MKKFFKKNIGTIVIVGIVALLLIFTLLVEGNQSSQGGESPSVEIDTSLLSEDMVSWTEETQKDQYVITVIGLSYCGYCADYKPIIQAIGDDENLKVYYFNIDTLGEENAEDANALQYTYNLEQYTGSSPYTFITKNGEFIGDTVGFMEKEETISFLQSFDVID